MLRDWKLTLGLLIVLLIAAAALLGPRFIDRAATQPVYAPFSRPPSVEYPLGTDNVGRDLFALLVYSLWPTLTIGLIAGSVGMAIGASLGLISGYVGGAVDVVVRLISDVALTVPTFLVIILIASLTRTSSIEGTALIVGLLAWAGTARAIRAQTLSLRERAFVRVAKLSHLSDIEIIFREIMPNLAPYLLAGFVGAIAEGILASVGLQLLGIGPLLTPNIGMTLNNAFVGGAMVRGLWWWWSPPVIVLGLLFFATFLISLALDEIANPRLRGEVL
jgi:peptide/nickel transport system permease protein